MTSSTRTIPPDLHGSLSMLDLYGILDTPAEPEFDDIVMLASEMCETPVSLISLVDQDRQWFKARIGFEACQTPIEQSVCAHALSSPDLLIIPDLTLDPRTRTNRLVTEAPHIRFYAGAPLIAPNGVAFGTLCVIDTKPRATGLTAQQGRMLQALARQVMMLLEFRRTAFHSQAFAQSQQQAARVIEAYSRNSIAAQEAGRIGTFDLDLSSGETLVSAEFCRIFGMPVTERVSIAQIEARIMRSDIALASNAQSRREGTFLPSSDYRIVLEDGTVRWISRHARLAEDTLTGAQRMLGTVQDITAQKQASERMSAMLELGDRLRDMRSVEEIAYCAAELLAKALDASRAGFGIVDALDETVRIQPDWREPGVSTLEGVHRFRDYGPLIDELKRGDTVIVPDVTTDPRTMDSATVFGAIKIRSLVTIPIFDRGVFLLVVFVHHDGLHPWSEADLAFARSFGDRVQTAIALARAEAEQEVLNAELSHRLKNTFATIQAITSQTLKSVPNRAPVEALDKRLRALGTAHDVLLRKNWSGAQIRDVLTPALDRLGVLDRSDLDGQDVMLGARGALSLSLVIHELATNALKYGAYANEQGRVAINWRITAADDGTDVLILRWVERGGPPVEVPVATGFGSRLIAMGLCGTGGVTTCFEPDGLSVAMQAGLARLMEAA